MQSKYFFLNFFLIVGLVFSCSDDDPSARENTAGDNSNCNSSATVVSWDGGVSALFGKYCASCHPGKQPTDYASYSGVKGNIAAEKARIDSDNMPPGGGISASEKAIIGAWITANMPQSDCPK